MVWVAYKVLGQWDLDLLLTEYCKERLESQLKNGETQMKGDNSKESTLLSLPTHLPVPIDLIFSSKPSSARPPLPFPTPLFSLFSLPSLSIILYLMPLVTIILPALLLILTLFNLPFPPLIYRHLFLFLLQSKV